MDHPINPFVRPFGKPFAIALSVLLLPCWLFSVGIAREPIASSVASVPGATLALDSLGISPQTYVIPDGVLVLEAMVRNPGTETAQGILVGRIVGNTGNEDRRTVELKAGELKRVELAIRLPSEIAEWDVDIEVTLNIRDGNREVMVYNGDEPIQRRLTLPRQRKSLVTAVAVGREPTPGSPLRWTYPSNFSAYELAIASRVDASLSRQCLDFDSIAFPLNVADWKCIDTLIVASPKVFDDASSVEMIRKFLQSGGRVWVMLDSIETDAVSLLLAENQQCKTIETVELNHFEVQVAGPEVSVSDRTVDVDVPVRFKHVMHTGGRVLHRIGNWPVTIEMPVGKGNLFLSTLEASAWIVPRRTQWSESPWDQSDYEMRGWAKGLANQLHFEKTKLPINLRDASYPISRIGNPVVSRTLVGAILLLFCFTLALSGIWKYRTGDLRSIGWLAPALSCVAVLPLVAAAAFQRKDIPAMVSILQFADFSYPSGGTLHESAAVYDNESRDMELVGQTDGLAEPSNTMTSGIRTVTTSDFQQWKLSNVAWPVGTWRYTSESSLPSAHMVAHAELTSNGLLVEVPKDMPSELSDSIVNFVPGAATLGKRIDATHLLFDGEYPASKDRYTLDSMVSDEQVRRGEIYRRLFDVSITSNNVPTRTLCGWTDLWSEGPKWSADLERRGTAINLLPIHLVTPAPGSNVVIPHSLIEVRHAFADSMTTYYLDNLGRWIQQSTPAADVKLAFHLPPEAIPLQAESLTIDWDIRAPRRSIRISCLNPLDSTEIDLVKLNEPSIPGKSKIDNAEVLRQFTTGKLVLRVEVSEDAIPDSPINWHIEHLRVSVAGKILPRNSLSEQ